MTDPITPPDPVRTELHDDVAVVIVNSPPVNALGHAVRLGLLREIERNEADDRVRAVVILCEGRTFIAGADIKEIGATMPPPRLPQIQDAMDAGEKPIVAAMHGTALGGGLELALAAHYRLAVPSARFGLPEVKLGLLPGAGGTQRLPRLIGPEPALRIIAFGEMIGSAEALSWGVLDALTAEATMKEDAIAFARAVADEGKPLPRVRDRTDKLTHAPDLFDKFRAENAARLGGIDAIEYVIRCVQEAERLPLEEGMAFERECFNTLVSGEQSEAMRYQFFAQRKTGKVDPKQAAAEPDFARLEVHGPAAAAVIELCESAKVPAVVAAEDPKPTDLVIEAVTGEHWTAPGLRFTRYALGAQGSALEIVREGAASAQARSVALMQRLATACVLTVGESPGGRLLTAGREAVAAMRSTGVSDRRIARALSDYGFAHGFITALALQPGGAAEASRDQSDEGLRDRVLYPMMIEALRLAGSGAVERGSDIDALAVLGLGWPIYRGGPVFAGEKIGSQAMGARLAELKSRVG